MEGVFTTEQAAAFLGIKPDSVRDAAERGALAAVKMGRFMLFELPVLLAYQYRQRARAASAAERRRRVAVRARRRRAR